MTVKRFFDELYVSVPVLLSFLSQLYHFVAFRLEKPKMRLENGMLIMSVDVGSKELGVIKKGKNDANVNRYISEYSVGAIEERGLPLFVNLFNDFEKR